MTLVKCQNQSLILKYLINNGPVSRKDIAKAVGLTSAAVTIICNELISEGIIHEVGRDEEATGAGRRRIFLDINYDSRYILAFNIEPDSTTVALCNMAGDVVEKKNIKTAVNSDPHTFLSKLCDIAKDMAGRQSKYTKDRIVSSSVGIVGPIDSDHAVSLLAYGIWDKPVDIKAIMEKNLSIPCIVENNVNAFTKATMFYSSFKKHRNLHIIKWGPGVGSAVVINGKLYEGINGRAAELGHVIVEKDGDICSCGKRGCLETKVSINALNKIIPFDKNDFYKAYVVASEKEKEKFDYAIDVFARSIVNSITLFAPSQVLLSGYLFKDNAIREMVIERCKKYDSQLERYRIIPNSLIDKEDYIGPVGAYLYELLN